MCVGVRLYPDFPTVFLVFIMFFVPFVPKSLFPLIPRLESEKIGHPLRSNLHQSESWSEWWRVNLVVWPDLLGF